MCATDCGCGRARGCPPPGARRPLGKAREAQSSTSIGAALAPLPLLLSPPNTKIFSIQRLSGMMSMGAQVAIVPGVPRGGGGAGRGRAAPPGAAETARQGGGVLEEAGVVGPVGGLEGGGERRIQEVRPRPPRPRSARASRRRPGGRALPLLPVALFPLLLLVTVRVAVTGRRAQGKVRECNVHGGEKAAWQNRCSASVLHKA